MIRLILVAILLIVGFIIYVMMNDGSNIQTELGPLIDPEKVDLFFQTIGLDK